MKEKFQYFLIAVVFAACFLLCMFGPAAILKDIGSFSEDTIETIERIGGWAGLVVGYCVCKVFFGKEEK